MAEFLALSDIENGYSRSIETVERSAMAQAYEAGAAGLPCAIFRGYKGADLPKVNPAIKSITCPFTGEALAAIPDRADHRGAEGGGAGAGAWGQIAGAGHHVHRRRLGHRHRAGAGELTDAPRPTGRGGPDGARGTSAGWRR